MHTTKHLSGLEGSVLTPCKQLKTLYNVGFDLLLNNTESVPPHNPNPTCGLWCVQVISGVPFLQLFYLNPLTAEGDWNKGEVLKRKSGTSLRITLWECVAAARHTEKLTCELAPDCACQYCMQLTVHTIHMTNCWTFLYLVIHQKCTDLYVCLRLMLLYNQNIYCTHYYHCNNFSLYQICMFTFATFTHQVSFTLTAHNASNTCLYTLWTMSWLILAI